MLAVIVFAQTLALGLLVIVILAVHRCDLRKSRQRQSVDDLSKMLKSLL